MKRTIPVPNPVIMTVLVATLLGTTANTPVFAQAYKGQLTAAAMASVPSINSTLDTISNIQESINRSTMSTNELKYLLCNLITENDALYVMLSKRSRDLAELRARFTNTPYMTNYDALMKSLTPERVPQHPRRDIERIRLYREQSGLGTAEITARTPRQRSTLPVISLPDGTVPERAASLHAALDTKKELLENNYVALEHQKRDLLRLNAELTRANAALKESNTKAKDLIFALSQEKIAAPPAPAPSVAITPVAPPTNTGDDQQFTRLMAEYGQKIERINALKKIIDDSAAAIIALRATVATQNTSILSLTRAINAKDAEIASFKDLLAKKDAVIGQQSRDLSFVDTSLNTAKTRLNSIDALLKKNDNSVAGIHNDILAINSLTRQDHSAQTMLTTLQQEYSTLKDQCAHQNELILQLTAALNDMKARAADKDVLLQRQGNSMPQLNARIAQLERQHLSFRSELAAKDSELRRAQLKLSLLETALVNSHARTTDTKERLVELEDGITNTLISRYKTN
jgi:DNA repair exonuclease SbcCD ATPase subunit